MYVNFDRKFKKQFARVPVKIKRAFNERLALFLKEPSSPRLNNHGLQGKYIGKRSINITGDWRAIFSMRLENDQETVVFEVLGTHSQLYK